jgi:Flp pilus assembly protein CpaB
LSTRARAILISIIGVLLLAAGIGASVLLINRINAKTQSVQEQSQIVKGPVVVLNHDMSLGDRIESGDISVSQVAVEVIPRDAVTTVESVIGKYIKSDMVQGEMLLQHNVADPTNNNHDLSFILSDDHVLMAFPSTDLMSTEGVIQRGDIIDILASFTETVKTLGSNTSTTATSSSTVATEEAPVTRNFTIDAFQKITVTALVVQVVGTDANGNSVKQTSSYLLALDPQDALVLKHLKDQGATFDIVLRAPTSTNQFDLTPVTEEYITELYGLEVLP